MVFYSVSKWLSCFGTVHSKGLGILPCWYNCPKQKHGTNIFSWRWEMTSMVFLLVYFVITFFSFLLMKILLAEKETVVVFHCNTVHQLCNWCCFCSASAVCHRKCWSIALPLAAHANYHVETSVKISHLVLKCNRFICVCAWYVWHSKRSRDCSF